MNQLPSAFWCVSATEILQHLETPKEGLTGGEARQRLARYGSNFLKPAKRSDVGRKTYGTPVGFKLWMPGAAR